MTFNPYPSIDQLHHVVRGVSIRASYVGKDEAGEPIYDGTRPKPTLDFLGTVKVHGTNAGITRTADGQYLPQNRSKTLKGDADNYGFRAFVEKLPKQVLDEMFASFPTDQTVSIFGEWAGKGVQKGVAVGELDRFFYVFGVKIGHGEESTWVPDYSHVPEYPDHRIFNAMKFPTWQVQIDFGSDISLANKRNQIVEITEDVEKECPVGKRFGVSGVGEGVVWSCITPGYIGSDHTFKVKGKEHSVSKVDALAPVNVEKVKSMSEFAEIVVSKNRCEQGLQNLRENGKPLTEKSTGDFLRWVYNDVMKEERDRMEASGLEEKDVGKAVGTHARTWYFAKIRDPKFVEENMAVIAAMGSTSG